MLVWYFAFLQCFSLFPLLCRSLVILNSMVLVDFMIFDVGSCLADIEIAFLFGVQLQQRSVARGAWSFEIEIVQRRAD